MSKQHIAPEHDFLSRRHQGRDYNDGILRRNRGRKPRFLTNEILATLPPCITDPVTHRPTFKHLKSLGWNICDECLAYFPRQEHLQRHMRTHFEYRPYKCKMCNESFGRSDNLRCHIRSMHEFEVTKGAGGSRKGVLKGIISATPSAPRIKRIKPFGSELMAMMMDPPLMTTSSSSSSVYSSQNNFVPFEYIQHQSFQSNTTQTNTLSFNSNNTKTNPSFDDLKGTSPLDILFKPF